MSGADLAARFPSNLVRLCIVEISLAAIASLAFALQFPALKAFSVLGSAAVTAGAATAIGAFLGFLFGIPKTLQSDALDGKETRYLANTNLEQISDWLTKILVGIGLVQISSAPDQLARLANALSPLFGGRAQSPAFGLALVLYSTVCGLLVAYLWTRALLRSVLQAADSDINEKIEGVLGAREDANAKALSLVERQLTGQNPPTQEELNAAIGDATPAWLTQIYRRAEQQRMQSWRNDKPTMERTIPVFQALIANDPEHRFHLHFGSLGYALKDKQPPDYEGALAALNSAIEVLRQRAGRTWPYYEWNRAVCRIRLDEDFKNQSETQSPLKEEVATGLAAAAKGLPPRFFSATSADEDAKVVGEWLKLNKVQLS